MMNESVHIKLTRVAVSVMAALTLLLPPLIGVANRPIYTSDSRYYYSYAAKIVNVGVVDFGDSFRHVGYIAHIFEVAFLLFFLGQSHYQWGVIVLGGICLTLASVFLAREVALVTGASHLRWLIPIYTLLSINLQFHGREVLTDVTFAAIMAFAAAVALNYLRTGTLAALGGMLAAVSVAAFYRPIGIAGPVFMIAAIAFRRMPSGYFGMRANRILIVSLPLAWVLVTLAWGGALVGTESPALRPTGWVFNGGRSGAASVTMPDPADAFAFLVVAALRLKYFFSLWMDNYSLFHNVYRIVYYGFAYCGVILGLYSLATVPSGQASRCFWLMLVLLLGLVSLTVWTQHIAAFSRYLVAVEPLVVAAGLAGWAIWRQSLAKVRA